MQENFITISLILLSVLLGSFYNAVIYRIPRKLNFVFPSSSCPQCNVDIKWFDNIPILSFIFLKAQCRHCKKNISFQYLLVEILSPLLMIFMILNNNSLIQIMINYLFFSFLLIIFFIDLDHKIIPNRLTYSLAIIGIVLNFYKFDFYQALYFTSLGSLIGGGPILLLMYIFKKIRGVDGMGMGDIKLFIVLGIWFGWLNCLLIIFISAILGSIIGIGGILFKKVQSRQELPFGPFIVISTLIIYFNEERIINLLF